MAMGIGNLAEVIHRAGCEVVNNAWQAEMRAVFDIVDKVNCYEG